MVTISTESEQRAGAMFSFAEGSEVDEEELTLSQCFQYGKAIAALHQASDAFCSTHSRYHLNLEYLVERPLQWVREFGSPEDKAKIESLMSIDELISKVKALSKDQGEYGIIHGDLHTGNLHFNETDQITLFDFDHCAYGWRMYDLWIVPDLSESQQEAVLKGYESIRPLTEAARQSIQVFAEIRQIWDIGDYLAFSSMLKNSSRSVY